MSSTSIGLKTQYSLEHYGTKGHSGRYPLGSGDRPYQGYGGLGKRKGAKTKKAYDREKKKLEKVLAKETERQKKAEDEARKKQEEAIKKAEAERIKILRDPAKLKKHQYEYSAQEIRDALERFRWEEDLHQQARKKLERGANIVDSLYKYGMSTLKLYNFAAGTHNSFNPDEKPWKIWDLNAGKNKQENQKQPKK